VRSPWGRRRADRDARAALDARNNVTTEAARRVTAGNARTVREALEQVAAEASARAEARYAARDPRWRADARTEVTARDALKGTDDRGQRPAG